MNLERITALDYLVFFGVLFATWAVVFFARRSLTTKQDHSPIELLLMGRKVTLPLFVASLVASWYGGISGVTAQSFEKGIYNFLTQGVFWYATYLVFAFLIIPKVKRDQQASSFPEIVGNLLGDRAKKVTAVLNVINLLPIAYVVSIGIFIKFLTGIPLFWSAGIGLLFVFAYSLTGGFRNVVFSDLVQFLAMMAAVVLLVVFSWIQFGSPVLLYEKLPNTHFDFTGGESAWTIAMWGFIAFSTLVDPTFYQRTLAATDPKTAKRGILLSTFFWFVFDCCTTLGAFYARVEMPHLHPEDSYLVFGLLTLPDGIRGLFLAGIVATILSTLDANLFSAASIFSHDLLSKKKFSKTRLQISIFVFGMISWGISPLFEGNVIRVWQILGGLSASTLLFPWLWILLLPKHRNEHAFLFSVAFGTLGHLGATFFNIHGEFYFGVGASILGFIAGSQTQNRKQNHSA